MIGSASLELPRDKATAEVLKDELVDLQGNRAYLLVQARLEQLVLQSQRLLEAEVDLPSLRLSQGELKGLRSARGMVQTLLDEIENTNYEERV
jgi:hypothetical protein